MSIIRAKVPKLAWISGLLRFFSPLRSSGRELSSKCHLSFRKSGGFVYDQKFMCAWTIQLQETRTKTRPTVLYKETSPREMYFPIQVKLGEHPSQPYSECPSPHQRPAVSSKAAKPAKGKAGEDLTSTCSLPTLCKSQEQRRLNDWEEPRITDLYTEECRQKS